MKSVNEIDWTVWQPRQRATLLFIIQDGQALLIHKKRGLGAGKINAPGGRLEAGETARQAAIRETQEEIGVTPLNVRACGELFFQFIDGLSLHCAVFRADDHEGDPVETDEAIPLWAPLSNLPYDRMWEDDAYWVPLMLEEKSFTGYFIFDGSRMVDHRLDLDEGVEAKTIQQHVQVSPTNSTNHTKTIKPLSSEDRRAMISPSRITTTLNS